MHWRDNIRHVRRHFRRENAVTLGVVGPGVHMVEGTREVATTAVEGGDFGGGRWWPIAATTTKGAMTSSMIGGGRGRG
jgi:hypothetical protein